MESDKKTTVELAVKDKGYAKAVADLRRILNAANDAETDWIREWYQSAVHDSTRAVAWNYRDELREAIGEIDAEALGDAVEEDVLQLGVEPE
jgi:hypothetical protein